MKDIIIIGTGKAALLHYKSYCKLKKTGNIYFVDMTKRSKYFKKQKIYLNIIDCIQKNELKTDNLIVDICTPKSEFLNILDECKEHGIKDILIEKPFVVNHEQIKKYSMLNIVMVQNYLYSKITKLIKAYILDNKKEIKLIYTNFSKNRIKDSSKGRGITTEITINYEIEIPHQIYLTQYILGSSENIQNSITCSYDMKLNNTILKNHGYGLIVSRQNDIDIIYESNLTSNISQKKIIICTSDNYTIEGNYALYSSDLKLRQNANINIYYNGKLMETVEVPDDDNFTYFMDKAYNYFNCKSDNPNLVSIIDFSTNMKLYCDNLLNHN